MFCEPYCSIFLFINSASGNGVGQKLLTQYIYKIYFYLSLEEADQDDLKRIDVYFFNMKKRRYKGFALLKKITDMKKRAIGVVCGGDGTIVWVAEEMNRFSIDAKRVPLAIIPLGTGNDFSQALGWGKTKTTLVENSFKSLKKLIRQWLKAKEEDFDLWDIYAEVFKCGKFEKVNSQAESQELPGKKFSRSFCNYFSIGIDGKIGYAFDMHRTTSRWRNLLVYGTMGIIKAATKTKTISELVEKLYIRTDLSYDAILYESKCLPPHASIRYYKRDYHSIPSLTKGIGDLPLSSKVSSPVENRGPYKIDIASQGLYFYNVVALNIDSFMGGVIGIWSQAKYTVSSSANSISKDQKCTPCSFSDGKLEWVSFSSSMGMAMERAFGGFASRIHQGGGPYYFTFREYPETEKHRTYLQIDGYFIRFTHPKSVLIAKSCLTDNGKIRILRKAD